MELRQLNYLVTVIDEASFTRAAPRARIVLGWRADGPAGPAARVLISEARERLSPPAR
jgi:DNA-binding transcriptional LysR family regulator